MRQSRLVARPVLRSIITKQYSFEKELDRRFDSDPEFAVLYWRKRKSEIFRHKKIGVTRLELATS